MFTLFHSQNYIQIVLTGLVDTNFFIGIFANQVRELVLMNTYCSKQYCDRQTDKCNSITEFKHRPNIRFGAFTISITIASMITLFTYQLD